MHGLRGQPHTNAGATSDVMSREPIRAELPSGNPAVFTRGGDQYTGPGRCTDRRLLQDVHVEKKYIHLQRTQPQLP